MPSYFMNSMVLAEPHGEKVSMLGTGVRLRARMRSWPRVDPLATDSANQRIGLGVRDFVRLLGV